MSIRRTDHTRTHVRITVLLALLVLGLALSACGNKGPLRQPDTAPATAARAP